MATIQGVYVALFGRPADPAGLAYFNGVTNNGANLSAIGNLAGQAEYTARFTGLNNTQIINSIYQSLFGRDAEAAGLTFFVDALNKGTLNINNIAIAILDGAQGTDKTIVTNKVAAADLFTKSVDTAIEIGSYTGNSAAALARTFISGVSTTAATQAQADAAVAAVVTGGAAGNTIALTVNPDTLSLTAGLGTPAVTTTDRADTINALKAGELAAGDKIDGGLGNDTVKAVLVADLELNGKGNEANFKNIENLVVAADTAAVALNVTAVSGLQTLVHDGSLDGLTANTALTATGVALTTTVGLAGTLAGATTFSFNDATGSADTANLTLAAATGNATIAAVETLNIANTGVSSSVLTVADAKTVNLSGSGELKLGLSGAAVETVSASAYTGKIEADFTSNAALKSYVGGTGSEKVTIDLAANTNDVTINTGAGADTIIVNAGAGTKALALTGGANADIFQFASSLANVVAVDTNENFVKTLVTISDFNKAADAIKFTIGATNSDTILTAEQDAITSATTLLAAANVAAGYTELNKVSVFTYGGDAYILQNQGGQAIDAGDTLIKVTGVTSVADFTASNFAFTV